MLEADISGLKLSQSKLNITRHVIDIISSVYLDFQPLILTESLL